jgi:Rrf2 family protein
MKLSSQEEYGLRCLLHLGRQPFADGLTIPEISRAEGISEAYVAKLMRILRQAGFVTSARGQSGGYTLARVPAEINIAETLAALGGRLFDPEFCERHAGGEHDLCTHSVDCSIRSLWKSVQVTVDDLLSKVTLKDLLGNERETRSTVVTISASIAPQRTSHEPVQSI